MSVGSEAPLAVTEAQMSVGSEASPHSAAKTGVNIGAAGDRDPEWQPISEWHPTRGTHLWWALLSLPLIFGGCLAYQSIAWHGKLPTDWYESLLLVPVIGFVPALLISVAHEAIHGAATQACGVRPQFGVLWRRRVPLGLYTTARGHRFRRGEYLAVALAPLVLLGPLGAALCWSPVGWVLSGGFGLHLAKCINDITIASKVARMPRDVRCEDLEDGVRFWSTRETAPSPLFRDASGSD
jgi:hypothetical protein